MLFKLNFMLLICISTSSRASRHIRSILKSKRLLNSESMVAQPNWEPEIPDHCRNNSFCEDVPNYPHEYIEYLLENNELVKQYFLLGGFGGPSGCKKDNDPNIVEMCKSEMRYVQAKAAKDTSGQWYFLVGPQGLCEELCTSSQADKPCININVYSNYKATCKQKKIDIPVAALINGVIVAMHPFLYAGCWCQITQEEKPGI